jgi:aliphatic sulfonates family ABC transporter substrate-binding protein
MFSRFLMFGTLLVLPLLAAPPAQAADTAPLPITIGVQTDADWLTIAAEKFHIFEKAGLKPNYIKFAAGAPMMAAAQSGSIDVATPGLVPFLAGVGAGIPWVTIGIDADGPKGEGFVARDGSGIRTLADLKGKRIGYFRASTAHYGLFVALQQNHISPDQVTLLSLAPVQQVAAMRAGQIDAAEVWEPWMHTMVADANGKVLATEADLGVKTAAGLYAIRRDWLATHREEAKRFLQAIVMANAAVAKDPQPVIKQFAADTGITVEWSADVFKEAPPSDPTRWTDPNYDRLSMAPGGSLQKSLEGLAVFLRDQKIVQGPIDVSNVIDASVISDVLKADHEK